MSLLEEAHKCRLDAQALADTPEAPFLLRIARAFEELAELNASMPDAVCDMPPAHGANSFSESALSP